MCHNLGAKPLANAVATIESTDMTFSTDDPKAGTDTVSSDAKGWLFQWGRAADGHQWRSSPDSLGQSNTEWTVADVGTNKFFKGSNSWRKSNTVVDDPYATPGTNPCPTNWYVPRQDQWSSLYLGGTTNGTFSSGNTFNKWVVMGTGGSVGLLPDGYTTTLYLPAAGYRHAPDASVRQTGAACQYLSQSPQGSNSLQEYLMFASGSSIQMSNSPFRSHGFSVRCVASQI
jgi:uncharacterized protein (TIGR02145 family)